MLNLKENGKTILFIFFTYVFYWRVSGTHVPYPVEDRPEQFFTQGFQQIILRFKMSIKGRSSHISCVNNLLHRDNDIYSYII